MTALVITGHRDEHLLKTFLFYSYVLQWCPPESPIQYSSLGETLGIVWFGLYCDSWTNDSLEIDHWPLTSPCCPQAGLRSRGSYKKLPLPLGADIRDEKRV